MSQHPPLLFVLVDASRWQDPAQTPAVGTGTGSQAPGPGPEFVAMGSGDNPPCVLVRSTDLDGIDAQLGEWMLETATRFADAQERYRDLTPRERQVLPLVTDGLLNKQAASVLQISEATLQIHRGRIMHKMGARSFAELVRLADMLGLSSGRARFEGPRDVVRPHRGRGRPRVGVGGGSAA